MTRFDPSAAQPLLPAFFARDTATVAREILGAVLVSTVDGECAGIIVEAEAYLGAEDAGSHAAAHGITARNRVMYGPPGRVYVYFTYGNHHMVNLITEPEGTAGAVLVRAIEPLLGEVVMIARRGRGGVEVSNGPGKVAEALGIELRHNDIPLGDQIAVYRPSAPITGAIATSGRVGLSSGQDLPLRFFLVGNGYVSKGRTGLRPQKRSADSVKKESG